MDFEVRLHLLQCQLVLRAGRLSLCVWRGLDLRFSSQGMDLSFESMSTSFWPSLLSTDNILSSTVSPFFSHPAGKSLNESGLFEYEEYISLKSINDPNEGFDFPCSSFGMPISSHSLAMKQSPTS